MAIRNLNKTADPWKALAAAILVNAFDDLKFLGGQDTCFRMGYLLRRWEVLNFFYSPWAESLADVCGIDGDLLKATVKKFVEVHS